MFRISFFIATIMHINIISHDYFMNKPVNWALSAVYKLQILLKIFDVLDELIGNIIKDFPKE
ncbi:hypothetical protein V1478_013690 [Vespula squamosa]|uniref:Uncharacterized protein n=1 Tax=Vespula squamosa TaxID=30214 RepID=A0ABD2A5W2_VESSQ